jgi:hypothetical protein
MIEKMDKETFIRGYLSRSKLEEYRTPDGYCLPGRPPVLALPCACGDASCDGWAMVPEDLVATHMELYAPSSERGDE